MSKQLKGEECEFPDAVDWSYLKTAYLKYACFKLLLSLSSQTSRNIFLNVKMQFYILPIASFTMLPSAFMYYLLSLFKSFCMKYIVYMFIFCFYLFVCFACMYVCVLCVIKTYLVTMEARKGHQIPKG